MSATNIVINEGQLKQAASRMNADIRDRLGAGKGVSHAWLLESLSQGLFGKPYGEVRSTLLASPAEPVKGGTVSDNAAPRLLLIQYGSEVLLTLDGKYVTASCPGSDMEQPLSILRSQAESLADIHDSTVGFVDLPEVLREDWEMDDVMELAETLGYFRYERPFHDLLSDSPLVIFKGAAQREDLDGDWYDRIRDEIDDGARWQKVVDETPVWTPEFTVGFDLYEMYFSFSELGAAREVTPNVWVIRCIHGGEPFEFEFRLVFEG